MGNAQGKNQRPGPEALDQLGAGNAGHIGLLGPGNRGRIHPGDGARGVPDLAEERLHAQQQQMAGAMFKLDLRGHPESSCGRRNVEEGLEIQQDLAKWPQLGLQQHADAKTANPLGPFAVESAEEEEEQQNGASEPRYKVEMGKRSPRDPRLGLEDAAESVHGKADSRVLEKQRSATEKEEGRFPKSNIIRLQYTNGDTYEGQINSSKQRDGHGVYVCADRKRTTGYEYHGYWKENARDGKGGKCYYYNEGFYIGDWQQDQRHGQGEHFYKYYEERYVGGWRYDMRYGNGTLINNGGSGSSGGGGQRHYEGRFKEDKQHGRGILKVTQNYQRFSTKQKEVKVYEQEWRIGKLVYQKKIHTVVGEEQIANLMLNTQFVSSKKHTQLLLHMYARNSRGEINFYENIKHSQLDSLISFPESAKSKRNAGKSDSTGALSQYGSEGNIPSPRKAQKIKDKEKSDALYKYELMNRIVGFQKAYGERLNGRTGSIVGDQQSDLQEETNLDQVEQQQIDYLNQIYQEEPELCSQWKGHQLLTFLLHQRQDLAQIMQPFVEHRIDGAKFFSINNEAELVRAWGINKIGTRKNLMRFIRRQQNLVHQREEERIQMEIEEQLRRQQRRAMEMEMKKLELGKSRSTPNLQLDLKEIANEAAADADHQNQGEAQGDFEDARGSSQTQRLTSEGAGGEGLLERAPGGEQHPMTSRSQQPNAQGGSFTWAGLGVMSGAFQGLSQYIWNNPKEKKEEENQSKPRSTSEKEANQEDPRTATDPLVSDLNDEFLDFEQCESQQQKEQEALPPVSVFVDTVDDNPNEQQDADDKAMLEQPLVQEKDTRDVVLDERLKAASAVFTVHHEQFQANDSHTLDLGFSLATPANQTGKAPRPGTQSQIFLPKQDKQELHAERSPIHIEVEDQQTKDGANTDRGPDNRPHNWMATEQSSVLHHDNSSVNFVSQTIDFKGKQTDRVKLITYQDEKQPELQLDEVDEGQLPTSIENQIETKDKDEQPQRDLTRHRDPIALNLQHQQMNSSNNEKLKKQVVGNIGKLHGVNIEKVRECNRKTNLQQNSHNSSAALNVAPPLGQSSATPRCVAQLSKHDRSVGTLLQSSLGRRRHQSHVQEQRALLRDSSRQVISRSAQILNPRYAQNNARSCNSRILGQQSALGVTQTPLDRQERERLAVERRQRKKKRQMSKNLIDILFQTEKDKEKERLKREKEKLRSMHPNISKVESSKGSRVNKNAPSELQAQDLSRVGSRGMQQNNNADQTSQASATGTLNQQHDASQLKLNASEVDGLHHHDDSTARNRASEDDDYGNLDRDAYKYLINTFNDNGFSFYIDIHDLKLDYKTDFLGGGGYGEVFKAVWMGNTVAVKRFGRKCIQKKSITDFIKEIEIINQVRHPNIIFYMGVSFDEHLHYYMVTEYVSRGSIFDLLHNNAGHSGSHRSRVILEEAKIFKIIKELASALQYLHSKQILHCDLKSQNILLTDDWTVKICDFGLARYQQKFVRDNYGQVGTPHWMAPEILRGETYTRAADVYSFGVILWELVTGEIPHKGRSHPQIVGSVGYHAEKLKLPTFQPQKRSTPRHLELPQNTSQVSGKHLYLDNVPSQNVHLRKIIELCTKYDASQRPTFSNILCYLEKIELSRCQKHSAVLPSSRFDEDLHHEQLYGAGLAPLGSRHLTEVNSAGCFNQMLERRRKLGFADYYQKMMQI